MSKRIVKKTTPPEGEGEREREREREREPSAQ